jgi:steroid delta-isomerase-like uncharacterized protein
VSRSATDITEANKAVVRRLYEEFHNSMDLTIADDLYTPDCIYHGGHIKRDPGKDGNVKAMGKMHDAFPDLQTTIDEMVAEGDKVVVRLHRTGTHKGEYLGFAATGKRIEQTALVMFRIENGKIAEYWLHYDELGLLLQIGAIPALGNS